jgi:predicted DNA-binding transcriptional regulator YafY
MHPTIRRQQKLIELLQESKEGMIVEEIAAALGVSEKTVKRDLKDVKDDWDYDFEKIDAKAHNEKCYKLPHLQPGSKFNFEEAIALTLGNRFLSPLEKSSLAQSAKEGLQKIKEDLPLPLRKQFGNFLNNFYPSSPGQSNYADKKDIFEKLIIACEDSVKIEIEYGLYKRPEKTYTIEPYALIMQQGTLYLLGLDCDKKIKWTWKVNRMKTLTQKEKSETKKPSPQEIKAWQDRVFGGVRVQEDRPVETVQVKVTNYMANYVREHKWHATQEIIDEGVEGEYFVTLQFKVVPTPALTNWILALGRDGEVLEPQSLREKIAEEISVMNKKYEKS